MTVTILHNPDCSKSCAALKLLEDRHLELAVIDYMEDPPDVETLREILKLLDLEPRQLMRQQESIYWSLGLDDPDLTPAELIGAMARNPSLIERPIVLSNGKAAIGRPPEAVLQVLGMPDTATRQVSRRPGRT